MDEVISRNCYARSIYDPEGQSRWFEVKVFERSLLAGYKQAGCK